VVCGIAAEKRELHWKDVSLCGNVLQNGRYKNSECVCVCVFVCVCVCVGAHWIYQAHDRVGVWDVVPTVTHIFRLTVYWNLSLLLKLSIHHEGMGEWRYSFATFVTRSQQTSSLHIQACRICSSRKKRWWLINVNLVGPRSGENPMRCHTIIKPFWIAGHIRQDNAKLCNSYGEWKSVLAVLSQINPTRCTILYNISIYFSSVHVSGIQVPIIRRK